MSRGRGVLGVQNRVCVWFYLQDSGLRVRNKRCVGYGCQSVKIAKLPKSDVKGVLRRYLLVVWGLKKKKRAPGCSLMLLPQSFRMLEELERSCPEKDPQRSVLVTPIILIYANLCT